LALRRVAHRNRRPCRHRRLKIERMPSQIPARAGHHAPPATLDGPDKVAALLLAMGRPIAGKLLVHFAPNELKVVTRAAADLPAISPADLERIIEEFAQHFSEGASVQGTAAE